MIGYVGPIQKQTEDNDNFRKVLFTGKHAQLVLMSIAVGDDIGVETHDDVDQFFRIDGGKGAVIMEGERHSVEDGDAFIVPAGTKHNVINTSESEPLRLYSVYSPPNHPPGTIHKTKGDAVLAEKEKEKRANGDEEGEEEESGDPGKKLPLSVIKEFFKNNPKPDDDKVHDLAEAHGAVPSTVEEQIYAMVPSQEGKVKTAAFFDELHKIMS
jgi:mannose-6-phosphate isomerase-like protein (cupin superfamily)